MPQPGKELNINSRAVKGFQRVETSLPGVCLILAEVRADGRGFFLEAYHQARFAEMAIADHFVQDNHSRSSQGVLRGLHYQLRNPQAKLCRVIEGEVLDVAVDIRLGSPHFGKWTSVVLSAEEKNQVYIPKGFAHGYAALSKSVQFLYKCSDFYDRADEYGVAWNDPDLKIDWRIKNPSLSEKDKGFSPLAAISRELLPRFP